MSEAKTDEVQNAVVKMAIDLGYETGVYDKVKSANTNDAGRDVLRLMDKVAISMGLLQNPEDYLIDNGAPAGVLEAFLNSQYAMITKAAAKATGASEEQLADKTKRTPEQERVMMEISGRYTVARMNKYLESDYLLANNKLKEAAREKGYTDSEATINHETGVGELEQAVNYIVRYFFATHTELDPRDSGILTETHFSELYALLDKALAIKAKEPNKSYIEAVGEAIGVTIQREAGKKTASLAISTIFPQSYRYPTDKATQYFFSGETDNNEIVSLAMEDKKSKKEITTLVSISFETLPDNVKIPKWLDLYDCAVLCAIASLYRESGAYMTTATIYKVLTGDKEARLSKSSSKAVEDSITRLMGASITIDASQEATQYKLDPFTYKGNILHAEYVSGIVLNGTPSTCLHVLREPVLFAYAGTKNQIASIPVAALNTPINKSREVITLQLYLLQRISAMPKISTTILYSTLFKKLNINVDSDDVAARKKQATIRSHVARILDDLQTKGYILGYKETIKGKKFYSVEIEPSKTVEPLLIGGKSRYGRGKKSVR